VKYEGEREGEIGERKKIKKRKRKEKRLKL
jgi:hypothetical protein